MPTPALDDAERRRRLVARHHLARTAADPAAAVGGVVAMHSSDPLTPYLGAWARMPGFRIDALDDALYVTRSLWRMHAMRRTLFVVPADAGEVFEAAAGRDHAQRERARLERWLEPELPGEDVPRWLAAIGDAVVTAVSAAPDGMGPTELAAAVPELATEMTIGTGRWTTRAALSSRLPLVLGMEAQLVRGAPAGSWRSSQYRWATPERWFGRPLEPRDPSSARIDLVRRYLAAYGPATTTDVRWWTGWTAKQTAAALAGAGTVTVPLTGGRDAYVLADDVEPEAAAAPSVALLPGLDPTPMGWKERDWYLGDHVGHLFDRNGNVGPTVWLDGRVVGGWAQRPDGEVVWRLLEDVGREGEEVVAGEAAALTTWLDGVVTIPRFRTPLERDLAGG